MSHSLRSDSKATVRVAVFLCLASLAVEAAADEPRHAGWLQGIAVEPSRTRLTAKLDTGAKSSSIHALDIEHYTRTGVERVRFALYADHTEQSGEKLTYDLPVKSTVKIKRHDGKPPEVRYTVLIDFCIDGETFTAEFGLDNRASFNYPVLLGREVMSGNFVVDPAKTFVFDHDCPASQP